MNSYRTEDGYFQIKFLMEHAHDTFIVGFDNIIKEVIENSSKHLSDLRNWIGYVDSWIVSLEHHHYTEEKILFPFFQEHNINIELELQQHEKLHKDLNKIKIFLTNCKKDISFYDPEKLKNFLNEMEANLKTHLEEEISHLDRSKLEPFVKSDEIKNIILKLDKEAKDADPFIIPIYMQTHTKPEYKYWADMGHIMYHFILPLLSMKHYGYWKYAPYGITQSHNNKRQKI